VLWALWRPAEADQNRRTFQRSSTSCTWSRIGAGRSKTTFTAVNAPGANDQIEAPPDLAAIAAAADPSAPRGIDHGVVARAIRRTAARPGGRRPIRRLTGLPPKFAPCCSSLCRRPHREHRRSQRPVPWGWIVASAALAIALVSTTLWWRNVNQLNEVKTEIAQLRTAVAEQQGVRGASVGPPSGHGRQAGSGPQAGPGAALAETLPGVGAAGMSRVTLAGEPKATVIVVPYGADALGGMRLEAVRPACVSSPQGQYDGRRGS